MVQLRWIMFSLLKVSYAGIVKSRSACYFRVNDMVQGMEQMRLEPSRHRYRVRVVYRNKNIMQDKTPCMIFCISIHHPEC